VNAHADQITALAFNPNNTLLVSGSRDETLRLWTLDGEPVGQSLIGHGDWIFDAAFRPGSTESLLLASAGADNSVILWDAQSGQRLGNPFSAQNGWVQNLDFSPDGSTLASGDANGRVAFWDVNPSSWVQRACELLPHEREASDVLHYEFDNPACNTP
jgi:WD40 repeat protein